MRQHHSPRCQHLLSKMHPHSTVTVCLACKVDPNVVSLAPIHLKHSQPYRKTQKFKYYRCS